MKITIREEGTVVILHSDNIRIGDYVIPNESLLVTMMAILRDVKRLGEKCEFVVID